MDQGSLANFWKQTIEQEEKYQEYQDKILRERKQIMYFGVTAD